MTQQGFPPQPTLEENESVPPEEEEYQEATPLSNFDFVARQGTLHQNRREFILQ